MSKLLTPAHAAPGGDWWTDYHYYDWFPTGAAAIRGQLGNARSLLVVGCGFGFDVDSLIQAVPANVTVWGCDASQYAVDQAKALAAAGTISAKAGAQIMLGDATSPASMAAVKSAMGLSAGQQIGMIVTFDMLMCCDSDAEVQTVLTTLRAIGNKLVHVLTPLATAPNHTGQTVTTSGGGPDPTLLWKTAAEWKALINNAAEVVYDWGLMAVA